MYRIGCSPIHFTALALYIESFSAKVKDWRLGTYAMFVGSSKMLNYGRAKAWSFAVIIKLYPPVVDDVTK